MTTPGPSPKVDVANPETTEDPVDTAPDLFSDLVTPPNERNDTSISAEVASIGSQDQQRSSITLHNTLDGTLSQIDFAMMSQAGEMWDDMDMRRQLIESQIQGDLIVVGAAGAAATSFTVGIVAWGIA